MNILRGIRRFFSHIGVFLRETRQELRKVLWPSWSQVRVYTLVVVASMVGIGLILWGTDGILSFVLGLLVRK